MKVIGVVGLPASGKGEFSRIAAQHGIPVVVMGDVIRSALMDEGRAPTDENLGAKATLLREEMGRDAIAKLTIPEIEAVAQPVVVVDGIRSDAEVSTFREHFHEFILVAITSSFDARFERLFNRKRSDDPTDQEQLHVRDRRELGWGLQEALEMADYKISNDSTLKSFEKAIHTLLKDLGA
jgi:dephospho-CoA kinase